MADMRVVVCAKEVLDPDAVNNYALVGKLVIGDDGKFERDGDGNLKVGTVTIEPGFKLMLSGKLILLDTLVLEGEFGFQISPTKLEITVDAMLKLNPIGELAASGALRIDSDGLVLHASLTIDAGFGGDIGLSFSASAFVSVNTTGSTATDLVFNLDPSVTDAVLDDFGTTNDGFSQLRFPIQTC